MSLDAGGKPRAVVGKLLWLEGLRFCAAVAVMLLHFQLFDGARVVFQRHLIAREPLSFILMPFYAFGSYGVQFFWLLSGVIFHIRYWDSLRARAVSLRSFAVARFSRLWPLAALTTLLVFLLQHLFRSHNGVYYRYDQNGGWALLRSLLFAQQWFHPYTITTLNVPLWSVSLEIISYAAFFILAVSLGRRSPLIYKTFTAAAFVGMLALCWQQSGTEFEPNPIFQCILAFFAGGALVYFTRLLPPRGVLRWSAVAIIGVGVLSIGVYFYIIAFRYQQSFNLEPYRLALILLLLAGLIMLGLLLPEPPPRLGRIMARAGVLTYASYLLQFPLLLAMETVLYATNHHIPSSSAPLTLGWFFLTLLLAYPCYRYFELPAQRFLRKKMDGKESGKAKVVLEPPATSQIS